MTNVPPSAAASIFKPYEHKNQHYVPAFWQRRFVGPNGTLFKRKDGKITPANADKEMSDDWIYTTFDAKGMPSNDLEFGASKIEAKAAQEMRCLDQPNALGTTETQIFLRWFVAFSACRHPDTMSMGHRRSKDFIRLLARAHGSSLDSFVAEVSHFGVSPDDGAVMHATLCSIPADDLLEQVEHAVNLAPTDAQLPQQIAISSDTVEHVFFKLSDHSVEILESPAGSDFVLGDTPFPPDLGSGFCLPISAKLALLWKPGANEKFPDWTRRVATPIEVANSNGVQIQNSLKTVVGPSVASLT